MYICNRYFEKKFMKNQILMVETNNKKFFTHKKNYTQLIEFSKTVDAEMSIVKVDDVVILDLQELAPAICNANFQQKQPKKIEIIEKL